MSLLRRHDEPAGTRYQVSEKLFAIADDFWIELEDGEVASGQNHALILSATVCIDELSRG